MASNNNIAIRRGFVLLLLLSLAACGPPDKVASPDGRIVFRFCADDDGAVCYSVNFDGDTVVAPSPLGLTLETGPLVMTGSRLVDARIQRIDSRWELPWGERRYVEDRHNELLATFRAGADPGSEFRVRVRVFDDGLGFRYEVGGSGDAVIVDEATEFRLDPAATAYWQPGDGIVRYEHLYRTTDVASVDAAHTPLTARLPSGVHLSIHEAALVDYAAYVLRRFDSGLKTDLRPWSDGTRVRTRRPFRTPWRTVQISPDAAGLINSTLILNLNEPNALGDVSWVQPGKYVGIWWAMHLGLKTWEEGPRHGATTEEAMRYVDFAADYGFHGVLVEGWNKGWHDDFSYTEAASDFDLAAVTAYARYRDVYIIGHHETYGDVSRYEAQMEAGFDVLEAAGVPQVKTGYVADAGKLMRLDAHGDLRHEWHDSQFFVGHLLRNIRAAAQRRISINTHEPVKDTGLRRTYPNWLTREGSRGQEFAIWGDTPNPPEHTVLLPFTRLLGGPMDFTPGMFNLHPQRGDTPRRVQTTLAKQLALYVVLYSPMQMVPDMRENYEARPDAFRFVIDVPTDWEDSIAVSGEVGDYVAIARRERGGDDWYFGAVADEEAREVSVPLAFLDPDTEYVAEIYRDADDAHWESNPYAMVIEERRFSRTSTLELQLAAGGGAAIRFTPAEKAE